MENLGYLKDERCNRNNCDGIINEHPKEGCCSCHINPPCSFCTTANQYCPVCGWDGYEEQLEQEAIELKIYNERQKNKPAEIKPIEILDDGKKYDVRRYFDDH